MGSPDSLSLNPLRGVRQADHLVQHTNVRRGGRYEMKSSSISQHIQSPAQVKQNEAQNELKEKTNTAALGNTQTGGEFPKNKVQDPTIKTPATVQNRAEVNVIKPNSSSDKFSQTDPSQKSNTIGTKLLSKPPEPRPKLMDHLSSQVLSTKVNQSLVAPSTQPNQKTDHSDIANFKLSTVNEFSEAIKYMKSSTNKPQEDKYGVTTWRFKVGEQEYEVNEFSEGAYNDVKTEDYHKRIDLMHKAAVRHVEDRMIDTPKREEYIKKLDKLVGLYKAKIAADCNLDPQKINDKDYFHNIHKQAEGIIAELAYVLANEKSMPACKDGTKFSLKALAKAEIEHVIERGRPIIINTFTIDNNKFVSMQTPLSETVLPSTARDREGLSNYVRTSFGVMDEKGSLEVLYSGIRHGIYPPYLIEDENLRQSIASNNVLQNLETIAKGMIENSNETYTQDNPLVVPLRTMLLVTVKKGDSLRDQMPFGPWKGESETTQLLETVQALRMYNNQSFQIEVNNKKIWVKPDISVMNFGANKQAAGEGIAGKVPERVFLDKLNARGFNALVDDIEKFILNSFKSQNRLDSSMKFNILTDIIKENLEPLNQENAKLNQLHENGDEVLSKYYKQLNDLQQEYKAKIEKKDLEGIDQLKAKIETCKKSITSVESEFDQAHLSLSEYRKKQYVEGSGALKKLKTDLSNVDAHKISNKVGELCDHLQDLLELYAQAESIFFEGKYQEGKHVMDFQVLYNLMQEKMHLINEFFCKSSEDRTGRLDDKMQEVMIFQHIHQRYPKTDNPQDKAKLDEYAMAVNMYSASQNNTEQNSNARGKQIGEEVNQEIPAKRGKMMGGLAKGTLKAAANLKKPEKVVTSLDLDSIVA